MYSGEHGGYKVLVMEVLGLTLHQVKEMKKSKKLSGKSILKIAAQLVCIINVHFSIGIFGRSLHFTNFYDFIQMDTFNYIHSKSIIFRDISSTKLAIGNSLDTINKIFVFDFTSSAKVTSKFTPKDDLIRLGLVLLELNGVEFAPRTKLDGDSKDSNAIIESLVHEWDAAYVKVRSILLTDSKFHRECVNFLTVTNFNSFFLGIVRQSRSSQHLSEIF